MFIYSIFRCKRFVWLGYVSKTVGGFKWIEDVSKIDEDFIKKLR